MQLVYLCRENVFHTQPRVISLNVLHQSVLRAFHFGLLITTTKHVAKKKKKKKKTATHLNMSWTLRRVFMSTVDLCCQGSFPLQMYNGSALRPCREDTGHKALRRPLGPGRFRVVFHNLIPFSNVLSDMHH